MIRLTLLLCAALYVGLMVLGADHGQKRLGLMMADQLAAQTVATAEPARPTLFIPAQPIIQPVAATAPAAVQSASLVNVTELPTDTAVITQISADPNASALPAPEVSGGTLYTVTAAQANVRDGPGRNFAVTGQLTRGEQVLVVAEQQPIEGWSHIRIEGDGIEGYVSTKLLTPGE